LLLQSVARARVDLAYAVDFGVFGVFGRSLLREEGQVELTQKTTFLGEFLREGQRRKWVSGSVTRLLGEVDVKKRVRRR
jgi:hypothetical protein